MDLRVQKTRNSIINAFIELRSRKPLEKITVKELADLAMINKATFFLHYKDIYDLSDGLENEIIQTVLNKVLHTEVIYDSPSEITRDLFLAFDSRQHILNIVFSNGRMGIFVNKLEKELKNMIFDKFQTFQNDDETNIMLSLLIQGCFHSFYNNRDRDMNTLMYILSKISNQIVEHFRKSQL